LNALWLTAQLDAAGIVRISRRRTKLAGSTLIANYVTILFLFTTDDVVYLYIFKFLFLPTNASMTHLVEEPKKEKNPDTMAKNRSNNFNGSNMYVHQPQWSRRLRRRSAAARLLRSWVPTPHGAWIFVVSIVCFQLVRADHSSRGALPTVVRSFFYDLETSKTRRPWTTLGRNAKGEKISMFCG